MWFNSHRTRSWGNLSHWCLQSILHHLKRCASRWWMARGRFRVHASADSFSLWRESMGPGVWQRHLYRAIKVSEQQEKLHFILVMKVCNLCWEACLSLWILNIFQPSLDHFSRVTPDISSPASLTINSPQYAVYFPSSHVAAQTIFFLIAHLLSPSPLTPAGITASSRPYEWVCTWGPIVTDVCVCRASAGNTQRGSAGGDGAMGTREFATVDDCPAAFSRASYGASPRWRGNDLTEKRK